jgi:hypothetical protein
VLDVTTDARVLISVPYLGMVQHTYPGQRGVEVVLDAAVLPELLP